MVVFAAEIGFLNGGVMNGRKLDEWVIPPAAHLGYEYIGTPNPRSIQIRAWI